MKISKEDRSIYLKRLGNLNSDAMQEIESLYKSGAIGEHPNKSTVIRAAIERIAERWEKGNVRDFNNLKRV